VLLKLVDLVFGLYASVTINCLNDF
jgi:hypothetical protein